MKRFLVVIVFILLWGLLSIPIFFSLPLKEEQIFFTWVGAVISCLILPSLFFYHRKHLPKFPSPSSRLVKLHSEYRSLHEKGLKQYKVYHRLTGISLILGWIFYFGGQVFERLFFTHPAIVSLCFLFVLFLGVKGIEKGNTIERKLIPIVLKGARLEKQLEVHEISYFSTFTRKRRIVYYFFRFLSLFLIIFPLFKFGILPLFLPWLEDSLLQYLIKIGPITLSTIFLGRFVFLPYEELMKKYQKAI